jgi:hypothetical protein
VEHELPTLPEYLSSPPLLSEVRVARSLVFCVVFCRSLFVPLSLVFLPWCCLSVFELRILITHLVSSNSSFDVQLSLEKRKYNFCIVFLYLKFMYTYIIRSNNVSLKHQMLLLSRSAGFISMYFKDMVFNATFNKFSAISWWSVLLVEETEGPRENH